MTKKIFFLTTSLLIFLLCSLLLLSEPEKEITLTSSSSTDNTLNQFENAYVPVYSGVSPRILAYNLPLDLNRIINYEDIVTKLGLDETAKNAIKENGFAIVPYGKIDDIVQPYKNLKEQDIPVFVTSDTLLHLYHIQFDETLKQIEEKTFYPDLLNMSKAFMKKFIEQYKESEGEVKEAARRTIGFFAVGVKLLEPDVEIPGMVEKEVQWELDHIQQHTGFPGDPFNPADISEVEQNSLFHYMEDYSQYVPRGHYTRSEALQKYFKAMMWYGRMTFLMKGREPHGPIAPPAKALLSPADAKLQTMQACMIAAFMDKIPVGKRTALAVWNRIYTVTAFYVGTSDDLSINEYREAIQKVFGSKVLLSELANEKKLFALKTELAKLPSPKIYGGTGQSGIVVGEGVLFTPEHLDDILVNTKGMRFMGQRFVPDSYIMSQLVSPAAGDYTGTREPRPFTWIKIPNGEVRGFPRGLDMMGFLGCTRAKEILQESGDIEYSYYDKQYNKLKEEFLAFELKDWNKNLYWSWLYTLKALLMDFGPGYQGFMRTKAWHDKELNAALGSWTALRHDTILFVKQSYTPTLARESVALDIQHENPVVGYVEPVADFYARLLALTRMTTKVLKTMEVLDDASEARLNGLEDMLGRLLEISKKELRQELLNDNDHMYIRRFAEQMEIAIAGAGSKAMKTTIVADVHTDQNTKQCLEEATGYVQLIVAAYLLPGGSVEAAAGPVFSYYEFKHPMADRFTDEKWQEMLKSGKAPDKPF
ncbi:MAG: hypothetical protein A2Y62_06225 [Candidatus Fischerbacteria bacterium RBG_13_37_8]|uniref:dTDP-glucose 4,6-dehydratase n=1 Tax=Candidatus Fischerbacteria bacterium RBG_13_37_8 TaxID=1817863 RepID=A0A1F5VW84_9BACT|nr:MAG: hypothetical protein A2Y62_06225 [Candidatus Fischerbacteria bacterium RBG_13_37_8]